MEGSILSFLKAEWKVSDAEPLVVISIYRKVIPIDFFDFEFPIVRNDWSE
jgi:hypothetical protein